LDDSFSSPVKGFRDVLEEVCRWGDLIVGEGEEREISVISHEWFHFLREEISQVVDSSFPSVCRVAVNGFDFLQIFFKDHFSVLVFFFSLIFLSIFCLEMGK